MACADVDMDIHGDEDLHTRSGQRDPPRVWQYQASAMMPDNKGPLHDLLQKEPAVLGSLQMISGLFSVGVGIILSTTQDMAQSLITLFRLSQLTGTLFFFAGVVANLLFKYPALLTASLAINCGCIVVAVVAACLITVDLTRENQNRENLKQMEKLELCVLGLEVLLSAILCFWFVKEKCAKSK